MSYQGHSGLKLKVQLSVEVCSEIEDDEV